MTQVTSIAAVLADEPRWQPLTGAVLTATSALVHAMLVRTGKFRPDAVEASRVQPDGIVSAG